MKETQYRGYVIRVTANSRHLTRRYWQYEAIDANGKRVHLGFRIKDVKQYIDNNA